MRTALRMARERKQLTQAQVAECVGISREYYVQLEAGQRDPSIRVAFRIGEVLDADPRWLFADVIDERAAESA